MSDTEGTQERPRRSARTPNKSPATVVNGPSSKPAARRKARDPGAQLDHLLTNSKSQLTKVDISDVLNFDNFLELSVESQELLCSLFPSTAFSTFQPTIDPTHPANVGKDGPESSSQESPSKTLSATFDRSPTTLDPVVFTSPFFLSAARTFQDHIYSGWLASKAKDLVKQYEQGVGEGSLHAEWKDEEWERNRNPLKRQATRYDTDLVNLAKRSLLKEGDLVVYRRHFASLGLIIHKELLVQSIHPHSHSIIVLLQPGATTSLPSSLLAKDPPAPEPPILSMDRIMGSAELEDGILDLDGRVPRADRLVTDSVLCTTMWADVRSAPVEVLSANRAAKSLTVWRWRADMMPDREMQLALPKGGREVLGTVFYLSRA